MKGEPIENGAVAVVGRDVVAVGDFKKITRDFPIRTFDVTELGDGTIVPGWVNAHTHLEFSDVEEPLGFPGIKFTDWIRRIVKRRIESNRLESDTNSVSSKSLAIRRGLLESKQAGTWAIGEIATAPLDLNDYSEADCQIVTRCFFEQLGRDPSNYPTQATELTSFLSITQPDHSTFFQGASPHAPYSVSELLFNQIQSISLTAATPVAMHIAETLEERELLEKGSGDFVDLLKEFGIWNPTDFNGGFSISGILNQLSKTEHALIVHGNYLNDIELDFIAAHPSNMSVAFCPRTHRFFQHSLYPLQKMLNRKINVCLGTDSRASNPDLNIFKEAQEVAASFPALSPRQILEMATINGSKALGLPSGIGTISENQTASLNYISPPANLRTHHPTDWIFEQTSQCVPLH